MSALAVVPALPASAGRPAAQPPEARGLARDQVRLLVGDPTGVRHHRFSDLPQLLTAGDLLIVNRSATLPAAVEVAGGELVVHLATARPDGSWLIELRRRDRIATTPYRGGRAGEQLALAGGATATLRSRYAGGRLWVAELSVSSVPAYLAAHGRPIRYGYVPQDWPLSVYQSVFSAEPGSAEMPSAGRAFTTALVTRLVTAGIGVAPITLHTGVASLEAPEPPYPEWFEVPPTTARLVNEARRAGGRVIAVGTTAARAIETAADPTGAVRPARGWTELVITPTRGVRVIDGLLTGFHEPQASHLELLTAVAGRDLLARCYADALSGDYLWHEFGDLNLLFGGANRPDPPG